MILSNGNEDSFTPYGAGFGEFSSTYYGNGALNQMTFPNAAKLAQRYNSADLATSRVFTNSSGTKLSAWESIGYDENNNRKTETVTQAQPAGASPAVQAGTGTFDYDSLDRLKSFKHPFETTAPVTYGLDDAGNVTSESAPAVTFTFANNRVTGRSPALPALPSSYGYDHFGNQITDTEIPLLPTTTSYNAASHTRRVTALDGTWVEYSYDGLERMVSRTDNTGAVVLFFHDGLSDQIALEHDTTKAMVTTRYLVDSFGVARGKQDTDNSTGASYYMTDPRANVTQMVGASDQAVKAVFAYDPYGKDKAALSKKLTPDWDSRLKFQMAPKDPKTGFYNIGSRLMNPTINRFVGSDNYVASGANLGLQMDPLTGNRYLYAGANPAGLIDDGHGWSFCSTGAGSICFTQTKNEQDTETSVETLPFPIVPPLWRTNSDLRPRVAVDANVIIRAIEQDEMDYLDKVLRGRRPVVSPQAVREYFDEGHGSADGLREFLQARGGYIGPESSTIAAAFRLKLDIQRLLSGRIKPRRLRYEDSLVLSSAFQEGIPIITDDRRFSDALGYLNYPHEPFPSQ